MNSGKYSVLPESPSCLNRRLARIAVLPESQAKEKLAQKMSKKSVQKYENYGKDFGPPRFGRLAVLPGRLAVSSPRLAKGMI